MVKHPWGQFPVPRVGVGENLEGANGASSAQGTEAMRLGVPEQSLPSPRSSWRQAWEEGEEASLRRPSLIPLPEVSHLAQASTLDPASGPFTLQTQGPPARRGCRRGGRPHGLLSPAPHKKGCGGRASCSSGPRVLSTQNRTRRTPQ